MQISIEDFKTGWYGITLGLKKSEIDSFIQNLIHLRDEKFEHFHGRSLFDETCGIADIEFHLAVEESKDNMVFDYSEPIEPVK